MIKTIFGFDIAKMCRNRFSVNARNNCLTRLANVYHSDFQYFDHNVLSPLDNATYYVIATPTIFPIQCVSQYRKKEDTKYL